jgi:hypothetical protein
MDNQDIKFLDEATGIIDKTIDVIVAVLELEREDRKPIARKLVLEVAAEIESIVKAEVDHAIENYEPEHKE